MKHLVSLAMKYVRRQKLRTLLTFLCVTLAVFILNAYALFCTSMVRTMRNQVVLDWGDWEIDLYAPLEQAANNDPELDSPDDAALIAKNHPTVDKLDYVSDTFYRIHSNRDENGYVALFEVSLDNGESTLTEYACQQRQSFDSINPAIHSFNSSSTLDQEVARNSAIVPQWFHKAGYNKGDTVTITISPFRAKIDMDCDVVKTAYQMVEDNNADPDNRFIRFSDEEATDEQRQAQLQRANQASYMPQLLHYIAENLDINEVAFTDREDASPLTVTLTIAGFSDYTGYIMPDFIISTEIDSDIDLSPLADVPFLDSSDTHGSALAVMNQKLDFDDCLCALFEDLGQDGEGFYQYLIDSNMLNLNEPLLAANLRSFSAIVKMLPVVIVFLILMLIIWFFARFIIDNAFEISVSERSSQFALLRIMGASKGQLLMLVFTEGVFYSITAVPLGVLLSYLTAKFSFESLHSTGIAISEFYPAPAAIILAVILSLAAIFISTYTSAMWAARKMSPTEAMNIGKPQKRRKKSRRRKSQLDLGSKRFTFRYTLKNIFRTKSRFIVSTIALSLGVAMFTLCLELGILFSGNVQLIIENASTYDYAFHCDTVSQYEEVSRIIGGNDSFRDTSVMYNGSVTFFSHTKDWDVLTAIKPQLADHNSQPLIPFESWGKNMFDRTTAFIDSEKGLSHTKSISELLGKTYEEFQAEDKCYLVLSTYGMGDEVQRGDDRRLKKIYEESFLPVKALGLGESASITTDNSDTPLKLAGIIYAESVNTAIIAPEHIFKDIRSGSNDYYSISVVTFLKDAESYDSAQPAIEEIQELMDYHNVTVNYMMCTGFRQFVRNIIIIVLILMLVIWLSGIFSMMNTINTSVLNRSRELLMMRSVGMTKKQLTAAVMLEAILFSSVSTLIGIAVSSGIFAIISTELSSDINQSAAVPIIAAVVISLLVNVLIACLAALPGVKTLGRNVKQMLF